MMALPGSHDAITGNADLGDEIRTISRYVTKEDTKGSSQVELVHGESANNGVFPNNGNLSNPSSRTPSIANTKVTTPTSCAAVGKRTIIVEPALALMFSLVVSAFPLRSQYVYWAIGEKYNLSALQTAVNTSDGEGRAPGCGDSGFENGSIYLLQQKVQAEAAEFNLILDISADIPALFVTLFMGTWTDNHGRRPALILPLVGVLLQCSVYVIQQVASMSLYVMILGGMLGAFTGGMGTFVNACFSYYSDTIPSSKLGRRILTADLIYGLVLALMQVVMGYLTEWLGFVYPYIIIMTGHVVNLLYVIFFVPESKKPVENKMPISPKYILSSFKVLTKPRPTNGRLVLLLGVVGRCAIVFFVWPRRTFQTLYLLNTPLCWSPTLIGIVNAFSSIYANLCQLLMALVLLRHLQEHGCLVVSVVCCMLSTLWFGISTTTWMVFLVPVIGFTQGAALPILRAILSTLVSPDEQGALFASLSTTTTAIDIVGGILFNLLYTSTLLFYKGTTFLVMGAGLALALIIIYFFRREFLKKAERDSWLYKVPQSNIYSVT